MLVSSHHRHRWRGAYVRGHLERNCAITDGLGAGRLLLAGLVALGVYPFVVPFVRSISLLPLASR